jgi:hypothetical protein
MSIPSDPETLLTREATAAALTESGFPVASTTLATKATRGGGPAFQKFGKRPLYRWADVLAWARSKLGPRVTSTAQLENQPTIPTISIVPTQASAADKTPKPAVEQPNDLGASAEPTPSKMGSLIPIRAPLSNFVPVRNE